MKILVPVDPGRYSPYDSHIGDEDISCVIYSIVKGVPWLPGFVTRDLLLVRVKREALICVGFGLIFPLLVSELWVPLAIPDYIRIHLQRFFFFLVNSHFCASLSNECNLIIR